MEFLLLLSNTPIVSGIVDNLDAESLFWTKLGAIGSWAGSIFGAIALVISILAFYLPQRTKLEVDICVGIMLEADGRRSNINAYDISVKNTGIRPVTINNIYINFGGKKYGNIFVGVLNQGSLLQFYMPTFPKRLNQGEKFDYYLLKEQFENELYNKLYKDLTGDLDLYICVDEVVKGQMYYKTKWTIRTFINNRENREADAKRI